MAMSKQGLAGEAQRRRMGDHPQGRLHRRPGYRQLERPSPERVWWSGPIRYGEMPGEDIEARTLSFCRFAQRRIRPRGVPAGWGLGTPKSGD